MPKGVGNISFLKDLYDGEIHPCEGIPHTDEFKAAQSALSKAAKELDEVLTAEQKELFNAYKDRFFDCVHLSYAHAYEMGFLHGAKLINEIPKPDRLTETEKSVIFIRRHRRWSDPPSVPVLKSGGEIPCLIGSAIRSSKR